MLLRKLTAALCPLLLCFVCCAAFRWLDEAMGASGFATFLLKGLLLGLCLALTLPAAGIRAHTNGLVGWLLVGAGLLAVALLCQFLVTVDVLPTTLLTSLLGMNGQVVLLESAALGYVLMTALWYRGR